MLETHTSNGVQTRLIPSAFANDARCSDRGGHNPDPIDIHVGAQIRLRRRSLGISQEALAEELGLTFQQVQKYERGANRVSASKLWRIACVLKVDPGYFFPAVAGNGAAAARTDHALALTLAPGGVEVALAYPMLSRRDQKAVAGLIAALGGAAVGDEGAA